MNFLFYLASRPFLLVSAFLGLLVAIFLAVWSVLPQPPKTLTIATGFPEGLYSQFAKQLQTELAKEKISLEIRNTGGSVENLALMNNPQSGVDLAIVQSGIGNAQQYPDLVSLAGLFYEPLWVWYRQAAFAKEGGVLSQLSQLQGKRVSIGNEGSGTQLLTEMILGHNQIDFAKGGLLEKLNPNEAIQKLERGQLDAAFIVVASEAPLLQKFYQIPGIRLMDFDQAEAYSRLMPFLKRVDIPRGLISIAHDLPKSDIRVLASTAVLVGKKDINPATVSVLLGSSYDILRNYTRLQKAGDFPTGKGLDFPIDLDAEIFLRDGPSFFYRHLPFWGAVWAERFIKILIPLLIILLPIFTYLPAAVSFSLKIKLAVFYKILKTIEKRYQTNGQTAEILDQINELERRIERLNISALQSKEVYDLKSHVAFVRDKIQAAQSLH